MTRIKHEVELKEKLQRDVVECGKQRVVVQAGHFPFLYHPEGAVEGIRRWGEFSPYTLELGGYVGKIARDAGKDVQFVFFVDDHSYESLSGLSSSELSTRRSRLYRERSGQGAVLVPEFGRILGKFGFNERDVLRHDHGKSGREACLYFSEKVLRVSAKDIENACAREYTEFIERYFDKEKSHLVSFVPQRCRGHICDVALDQEIEDLSASHVFMETMDPTLSREELYLQGRGVIYRRDL